MPKERKKREYFKSYITNPPKQNRKGRPTGFKDPRKKQPLTKQQQQLQQAQEKLQKALETFWD